MKISEQWLREWIDPDIDSRALTEQLTMAGLEVDGIEPAAEDFSDVVIGHVDETGPHPNADKLTLCRVDPGNGEPLQIICGAPNVRGGLKVAVAVVGARLPDGMKIRKAKLRGVESQGMICSARELGLGDEHDGILELAPDAPVGTSFRDWMGLDDSIIKVDLTPNRGDCFSVLGIARDLAAINDMPLAGPVEAPVAAESDAVFPVDVVATDACPSFSSRVVKGIDPAAVTPMWMKERLRRSGLRPIHPVVDVTNYVMLELGQPLHAFDLATLKKGLRVRYANKGEKLTLLDGRDVNLDESVVVVADHQRTLAMAGIMGGEASGVSEDSVDILFEAAFWSPQILAGCARRFGLSTDASTRFERGVDPWLQTRAIERATGLLIAIAGGVPGPTTTERAREMMPVRTAVNLRFDRIEKLLGMPVDRKTVVRILTALGMQLDENDEGWTVVPPGYRFDIEIEEDLIEEIARIHGYDQVPETRPSTLMQMPVVTETRVPESRIRLSLVDRGYQEAMTYSFIPAEADRRFGGDGEQARLANPLSEEMAVMRRSLLPGLLTAVANNLSRQQGRVRLFETGMRYLRQGDEFNEVLTLSAAITGARHPEQWGVAKTGSDIFDIKSDLDAILRLTGRLEAFGCEEQANPVLSPGRSGRIVMEGRPVGWLGTLHPTICAEFGIEQEIQVFEIDIVPAFAAKIPEFSLISRFPTIRRDIAVLVDEQVSVAQLEIAIRKAAGGLLSDLKIFDIYRGERIDSGLKSIAFGLILQDYSRTLTDADGDAVVESVIADLSASLNARIRD